jgi:hypothetical protein
MRVKSFSQNFLSKFPRKIFSNAHHQAANYPGSNLLTKHFSTTADSLAGPNLYSESSKLESGEISSILRKKNRTPTPRTT